MRSLHELELPGSDLVLVVLGPGVGESVMVGWPPNSWLVVDSFCRTSGPREHHPAVDALDAFGGVLEAVALTHPHDDHTRGFASLIDRLTDGGKVGWWPEEITREGHWTTSSASLSQRVGSNEHAVAAIDRAWTESPSCRWNLVEDAPPLEIGDVSIEVLTPLRRTVAAHGPLASPNVNELSSAMRVRWRDCTLLLGADLVNTRGWEWLERDHGELAFVRSVAMKVSHHGSREAQHAVALGKSRTVDRLLVTSPYSRGKKVPDFSAGEDVQLLLEFTDALFLSGHHGRRPPGSGTNQIRRADLLSNRFPLPGGIGPVQLDAPQPPIEDCWVAVRWSANGSRVSVDRGPGSLLVVA